MYKKSFTILAIILAAFINLQAQTDSSGAGYSLKCTGTPGSYVNVGDNLNSLNFPFTIEGWVNLSGYPAIQGAIFSSDDSSIYAGFWFMVRSNGHLFIEFGDDISAGQQDRRGFETTTIIPLHKWVHVAAVCHSMTNIQLYFNGVLQNSGRTTGTSDRLTIFHNSGPAEIGDWKSISGESPFLGQIDELRIWQTARTLNLIQKNMCSHVTPDSDLVGYWRGTGSLTGTTVADDATLPHNGSIVGRGSALTKVVSGAPVGNYSTILYSSSFTNKLIAVTDPSGDYFKASAVTGNPYGVAVYGVDEAPYRTGRLTAYPSHYFGVFCAENSTPSTFRVTYQYANATLGGNPEGNARVFTKATDSSSRWIGTGPKPDTADNTITKNDLVTRGEFILNFVPSVMVLTQHLASSNEALFVSPNPAHNNVVLSFTNVNETVNVIRILNVTGEVIREIQNPSNNSLLNLDIANWISGIYFAEAITAKGNYFTRFIIQ